MENLNGRELELNWLESYASGYIWAHFGDGKKFMIPHDVPNSIFEKVPELALINDRETITLDEIVDFLGEHGEALGNWRKSWQAFSSRMAAEELKYADAPSEP
jgi:hypothetical protein